MANLYIHLKMMLTVRDFFADSCIDFVRSLDESMAVWRGREGGGEGGLGGEYVKGSS